MRILVLSDLHLEFDLPVSTPAVHVDLVILAGDIHNGGAGIRWARQVFSPKTPIVYVPGNHEYYGRSILTAELEMKEAATIAGSHFHFLNRNEILLPKKNVRVLGVTLWTDFTLFGVDEREVSASIEVCNRYMTDFNGVIQFSNEDGVTRRFTPQDAIALHRKDLAWLQQRLDNPFDGKTVVVTHHAPHPKSLADRYATDRVSAGFINDLTDLMGPRISLWVHGHTHDAFDYEINGVRVICNPRGYVNRMNGKTENAEFDWARIIEI
ncbi:MAG TPA: metallophosphoesterase [Burkholderiales bacterium]|nr:metallophosphoesterase [Burkholderiales bacterium]